MFLQYLFSINRAYKRLISIIADSIFLVSAFWLAMSVRLNFEVVFHDLNGWLLMLLVCPVSILAFIRFGLYRTVLRYLGFPVLRAVILGVACSTLSMVIIAYYFEFFLPRSVPFIYCVFSLLFIGGFRAIVRNFIGEGLTRRGERVIIYGAGVGGRQTALAMGQTHEYHPVAFIDDDKNKQGTVVQGMQVYSPQGLKKLIEQYHAKKVLLAMPQLDHARRQQILHSLEPLAIKVMTLPALTDLMNGDKYYSDVKDIEIEDLLGRTCVPPKADLMTANISGKVVMVTGAGGSIGGEICRQIVALSPKALVLFELSEYALYSIETELNSLKLEHGFNVEIHPVLGSVQKETALQTTMTSFQVQTLYHAAAYKHVPLVEYNMTEGVQNNVFGSLKTAKAAINSGVETFVLISSDKAVRPTNIMGASKRMAELIMQGLAKQQSHTRFCIVRFGNVLGSSGSVVPLFKKQISQGGPVTVTHPQITRFFMTIFEASQLVIQAGAMGKGGEVFMLDMGKPVKIVDLAKQMIRLSGFQVRDEHSSNGDIEIGFTGLRPGEKLYEELLIGDNVSGTEHERIVTADEDFLPWSELEPVLDNLRKACDVFDSQAIREAFVAAATGFNPNSDICDLFWLVKKAEGSSVNAISANKVVHLADTGNKQNDQ